MSLTVEKPGSQCPEDAGAAVHGGGAAHSDDDAFGVVIQGGADEFAGAAGGGVEGVEFGGVEQPEARRVSHFDNGDGGALGLGCG